MKILFVLFFAISIAFTTNVFATNYYVNSSCPGGGNGTTKACDGSGNSAWNELSDISGLGGGDTVYLNKGSVFRESLTITTNNVTIDAYGSGADPIISGADIISGSWSPNGDDYGISLSGTVYQIFRNDKWVHLAHEPDGNPRDSYFVTNGATYTRWNISESPGGDMPFSAGEITGAQLVGTPEQWFRQTYIVSGYSGGLIYLAQDSRGDSEDTWWDQGGRRYWLADKRVFLDSQNEWFHSGSTLYVQQPGGGSPNGTWEVTRRLTGISANTIDNLTIKNIHIDKFVKGIFLADCNVFDIDNVTFTNIGSQRHFSGWASYSTSIGVYITGESDRGDEGGTIQNCDFDKILQQAVEGYDYNYVVIDSNEISNIMTVGETNGFVTHGDTNSAVSANDSWNSIEWEVTGNTFSNTGYNAIGPIGYNNTISGNTILNAMLYLGDGGAIYQGGNEEHNETPNDGDDRTTVNGNFIYYTGGINMDGYGGTKCGIYLDSANDNSTVTNNYVVGGGVCLYDNHGTKETWTGNTCIDYWESGLLITLSHNYDLEDIVIQNNIFSSSKTNKHIEFYPWVSGPDVLDWVDSGGIDYNCYQNGTQSDAFAYTEGGGYFHSLSFSGWKIFFASGGKTIDSNSTTGDCGGGDGINTIFYVDADANAGCDGLSTATSTDGNVHCAFNEIADINTIDFADQTTIYFQKGDTFEDVDLTLNGIISSVSSKTITVDDYGSGALPIFGGNNHFFYINNPGLSLNLYNIQVNSQENGGATTTGAYSKITLTGLLDVHIDNLTMNGSTGSFY